MVEWFHRGTPSLIPIYHSYVREGKPHIYILRMCQHETFTYHAISCVHNLMTYTFGYVNFCDKCHKVTYLKNNAHRYCAIVTPGMQYNSAYELYPSGEQLQWRHHPATIQTRQMAILRHALRHRCVSLSGSRICHYQLRAR